MNNFEMKQALERVIEVIEKRGNFFTEASDEESCSLNWFVTSLAKQRQAVEAALAEHERELQKVIHPALDRLTELRNKIGKANLQATISELPDSYDIRRVNELCAAIEQFQRVAPETLERLKKLGKEEQ